MSDLGYALRSLVRARWFTVAAVLTFAIGIGVTVAVFSIVDRLLFRALPYGAVDDLVLLRVCGGDGECYGGFPSAIAFHGRARLTTIDGIAIAGMPLTLRPSADEAPLSLSGVSANLLRVLRVQPALGRDFTDEDAALKRRVMLLSHETWHRRFAASPDVMGRALGTGATPVIIIGILPPGFIPPTGSAVNPTWDGLLLDATGWAAIGPKGMVAVPVARLATGASVHAAQSEVDALVTSLASELRDREGRVPVIRVDPIQQALFSRFRPHAWLVVSAAFLLLLLACANLAALLLARGRSREHDAAIRAALGASPLRLVRAAVAESLLVSLIGAAVAMAVIAATSKALLAVVPPLFARYAADLLERRVLALAIAAAAVCAITAAVAPALRVVRVDVLALLPRASGSAQRSPLRGGRSLLAVEAAIGVVLVLSGLLVFRSFTNLAGEDLGFEPEGLYMLAVRPVSDAQPQAARPSPEESLAAHDRLLDALRDVPGVLSAGGADSTVASGAAPMRGLTKDPALRGGRYQVSARYFETLRTPFLAGRPFSDDEARSRAAVGILSVSAVRHYFPDREPAEAVGQPLTIDDALALSIVGVVPDLKDRYGDGPEPALFLPSGTEPSHYGGALVRMRQGEVPQRAVFEQRISKAIGPASVTLTHIPDRLEPGLHDPRFRAVLFSTLALAALLLAAIGLYAVTSFEVALRRYEMAVRLSLGASGPDILKLVAFNACRPVAVGVGIGLVGAYWAQRFLQSFLYGVEGRDPLIGAAAVAVLAAASVAAAWIPARRAAQVDPAEVLRAQ